MHAAPHAAVLISAPPSRAKEAGSMTLIHKHQRAVPGAGANDAHASAFSMSSTSTRTHDARRKRHADKHDAHSGEAGSN